MGIIWAALPGLSASMVMALLIGLTYKMSIEVVIAFMLGVFTATQFGGSISAILINIPGTPSAIPTQLAGNPLAKKGQGGLAIGMALISSMIGNLVGLLALALIAPLIIQFALKFSSWEIGLLALWGVAISGTLTASDEMPIKGWISGWLGLIIAMVGRDTIFAVERLTFGNINLENGIPYVSVLIGLFGMSEIFVTLPSKQKTGIPTEVGKVFPPIKMVLKYWKSIFRSSIIGLITGIMPGAGGNVGSFVAYGVGERMTKRRFADGDMEGVVCSEVANNANIGGALLPGLTLGIPGSAPVASFMAALALHGVHSGPMIDRGNPGILSFIYGALFVANIWMLVTGFLLIKPSIKAFSLPIATFFPLIGLLCIIGAFAAQNSIFDVYLMVGFGFVGVLLRKAGISIGPMILGVILGGLVDTNIRRTLQIYGNRPFYQLLINRPIGTALIVIILLTFFFTIRKNIKFQRTFKK